MIISVILGMIFVGVQDWFIWMAGIWNSSHFKQAGLSVVQLGTLEAAHIMVYKYEMWH
jgi:hypothetical protein